MTLKNNPIWIELLYLIAGLAVGVALRVNLPSASIGHPTLVAVPCDCVST